MPARSKAGRQRRARGRLRPEDLYASIRTDMLASQAFRNLSGHAVRILLLMELLYNPSRPWFVPYKHITKTLGLSPNTVSKALRELTAAGFIIVKQPGLAPRTMGALAAEGRATEYDLPHRRSEANPQAWKQKEDPRRQGKWRVHNGRLRHLVSRIDGPAAQLWAALHSCDHTADGIPVNNEPVAVTSIAADLRIPRTTAQAAIKQLLDLKVIEEHLAGKGRRASTYVLAPGEMKSPRRRRPRSG